jgi:ornithine cyclodeaminase/alanine dehydrogenase-like protein (mu-crystallin family)
LSEKEVRRRLDLDALIPAMERALAAFSTRGVNQPVRTVLDISGRGFYAAMPAHIPDLAVVGTKLVAVFPENTALGEPTHLATIVLSSGRTGETLAIMDGRYITEVRTAAVSAVSVRHLARDSARSLGIIGSGVQARSHVEMLRRVRPWTRISAWSPNPANLERFAAECGVDACSSAEEVVRGSDVVVTVTSAMTPVVEDDWARPGTHVIAVGSCRLTHVEIEPALVARSRLFVDSRAAASQESGDVAEGLAAGGAIFAELGEVVAGVARGRQSDREITMFKSLGLAVEDVVAAHLVYAADAKMGGEETLCRAPSSSQP